MQNGSENWPSVTGEKDPYMAHIKDYTWGSNGIKNRKGGMYYNLYQYGFNILDSAEIADATIGYLNYIHGVNPLNFNYLSNMFRFGANNGVREFYHTWFSDGSQKWDRTGVSTYGPAPGFLTGGPNPSYDWDNCCPTQCGSPSNNQMCYSESISPPKDQPDQKSYKDFNTSWPLNSWEVTENSLGYQLPYIRLLSKFINPEFDCNNDPGGEAWYDACGICAGGNTGRFPSSDPGNCEIFSLDLNSVNGTIITTPLRDLYSNGEFVTIVANPESGYKFTGWSGHASGTDNPLTIVMNGNKEITANFEKVYTLTVNNGSGSGEYVEGHEVTIEADTPPEGQIFSLWTGGDDYVADIDSSKTTLIMPAANTTVTAVFINDTLDVGIDHIDGISGAQLSLVPNPADKFVRLIAPGFDQNAIVSVISSDGRTIMHMLLGYENELLIDTSLLPKGNYIVNVSSKNKSQYIRLVVL